MFDTAKLKQQLIVEGNVHPDAIDAAEEHARRTGTSFTATLASSQIVSFEELGKCCAAVTGMPYVPLLSGSPDTEARQLLSAPCANAWRTYPVSYTAVDQRLTLAIHDLSQKTFLEDVYRFFLQPWQLAFTISSDAEIDAALANYVQPERPAGQTATQSTSVFARSGGARKKRQGVPQLGSKEMAARFAVRPAAPAPAGQDEGPFSYDRMGAALVNAVAMLVRSRLGVELARVSALTSFVRYCQLMAVRIQLPPQSRDALLMAAWLSGVDDKQNVIKGLALPHHLEELFAADGTPESERRIETWILRLIHGYQELKADNPLVGGNVNLTRRELRMRWSSAPERQDLLETFLQVLVDEEFLIRADKAVGRVLIVDPAETHLCSLAPSLEEIGFEVMAVPDAFMAETRLGEFAPDLLIVDMDLPQSGGERLCRRLRDEADCAGPPILALVRDGDRKLAVEALRAGADDYITKPVDLELLFLKVQRRFMPSRTPDEGPGVSGPLDEMAFTDMVQILSAGGKSLRIVLSQADGSGEVYMQDGEIVHAETADLSGEPAFYDLMLWHEGEFATHRCTEFPARTITASTMSLLMEGSRIADETTNL